MTNGVRFCMRYSVLTLIIIFFFSTETFAVNKLKVGELYSGTLTKLYWHKNTLMLPTGTWKLTELEKESHKISGSILLVLENTKNPSVIYAYFGLSDENGIRWISDRHFKNCADEDLIIAKGKGKTHSRSQGKSYWCVSKGSEYTTFSMNKNASRHTSVHYNISNSDISISETEAARAGKEIFSLFEKAFDGNRNVDLRVLDAYKFSSSYSSEYSQDDLGSFSDKRICLAATSQDGLTWEKFPKKYFDQAKVRNLSLNDCIKLTGRNKKVLEIDSKTSLVSETTVKSKLKELKSMLDEGLISQDQYDEKSSKILDEF